MQFQKEKIKQNVRIVDVCNMYGIELNRQGFAYCPFHSGDNTPSFKVYTNTDTFHCFGCNVSGDVIKFVQMYFRLDFKDSIRKLDMDFNLGIDRKPSFREFRKLNKVQNLRQKQTMHEKTKTDRYTELLNEYIRLDKNKRDYALKSPNETLHKLYIEAIHNIERISYLIDCEEI